MWNSTDDGGFGKGGFDQTGGGGFLNTTVTSPSTGEKKKSDKVSNVVPCTIAQIHSITEADEYLKIGSLTAKIVTFIGLVEKVDVQTTKITYTVGDSSGPPIEVQVWIAENEDASNKVNLIHENKYVRVIGSVRSLKSKHHILAFNITPIKDLNELTMHLAEVIHTSMSVAVMDKQAGTSGMSTTNTTDTFGTESSTSRRLSKPQQLVLQAVNSCKDEQGINVNELFNNLKSLNRQSIAEALDFLSNEGHIYSTIDENHYKSTDSV